MEYLPILLKIPEQKYVIGIDITSAFLSIQHTFCIMRVTPSGDRIVQHSFSVLNRIIETANINLTEVYKDSLELQYGKGVDIAIEDRREQELEFVFTRGRRSGSKTSEQIIREMAQKHREELLRREKEVSDAINERLKQFRQNYEAGNQD